MMDNRNLIAAVVMSMLILIIFQVYFTPDEPVQQTAQQTASQSANGFIGQTVDDLPLAGNRSIPVAATAPRISAQGNSLAGSLSLAGGRIDDLRLLNYGATSSDDENRIQLLRKSGTNDSYFAEWGFIDAKGQPLVAPDVLWQADGDILTPERPVTLTHTTDSGLLLRLRYEMDDGYLVTVTAHAENTSSAPIGLRHFARIFRNQPVNDSFFISYEGPIGVFSEDVKEEISYSTILDDDYRPERFTSQDITGWIGITDKYWLTALVPRIQDDVTFSFNAGAGQASQVDIVTDILQLAPGASSSRSFNLFTGPKDVDVLLNYSASADIERLDHAIDWGWFPFLTKPFFHALNWLYAHIGNFGLAILALTVVVKLAFFPLANKSYKSMAKMRELAPKIQELRARFGDDRPRQQKEMMELYRAEKINPAAGCLPILLQIPVFFALYKVLFINLAMRHAPFYGWISDLSASDPTSILNLFGLLPYDVSFFPDFLNLGIWPILMGITMFVQMSLNPPPPDPVQAKIFKFMPLFFTFILATFPAGLVIYWTWNNILSILQQMYIMRSVRKASQ